MGIQIGFILVTHNQSSQVRRLVDTLNRMFAYPNIVCHHNFSITPLETSVFPANVRFVFPHIKTKWGKFSTIDAEMAALDMLYQHIDPPDWFVILSGSDYPIKSADNIIQDLSSTSYDALIHHEAVRFDELSSRWQILGYERYCTVKIWMPYLDQNKYLRKCFFSIIRKPSITQFLTPFSDTFPCFVGDHFFCANSQVAKYLIDQYRSNLNLNSFYRRKTIFPTESYYQTVLCNSGNFRLLNNNYRYIDWNSDSAHPKLLEINDLPAIAKSSAHFARKFDITKDSKVLDEIDKLIY